MDYKNLGKSSLEVSEISFGCMSLGNNDPENRKLLYHALDKGINLFDTADFYDKGLNEITVGKAFKDLRSKVLISTKVGNQWNDDGKTWQWNPKKEYILATVEESLKRLQTDYIDLYQLHGGTLDDPIDETIEAFEILKQQGKIRYYGISSIRPNVIREYVDRSNIVSVMMQYNLLDRRPEETCFKLLKDNFIGVLARGPLAKGLLVDKPAKAYLDYSLENVDALQKTILEISDGKRSNAQTALKFVMENEAVASVVPGIRNMEQLKDCLGTIHSEPLTLDEIDLLKNSTAANLYENHR